MVVDRPVDRRQTKNFFERNPTPFSPVETEGVFIQIFLNMLPPNAVVDAESPPFQQSENPVDPRQNDVGGHWADEIWVMPIAHRLETVVPAMTVGQHNGPGRDRRSNERLQCSSRVIRNDLKSDPLRARVQKFVPWPPTLM